MTRLSMGLVALALMLGPSATMCAQDAALVKRTGADERGMRNYVLVILKTGPKRLPDGDARIEEAKQLTATDPVIVQGEMVAEYHRWYATAAAMLIPETHAKLAPKQP